jgi:hypothetical protein
MSSKPTKAERTVASLKKIAENGIAALKHQAPGIEQARALSLMVRTVARLVTLERELRSLRAQRAQQVNRFDDAERAALAKKLDGLHRELGIASYGEDGWITEQRRRVEARIDLSDNERAQLIAEIEAAGTAERSTEPAAGP